MKRQQVFEKLALVEDPELDQSLTELGFVHEVKVSEDEVWVSFRLPTFWCSPNFAFIMAEDIRDRVSELPWVSQVHVDLVDHCASEDINDGVANNKSFNSTFKTPSDGELKELRRKFRVKAFLARQERVYRYLVNRDVPVSNILCLSEKELAAFPSLDDEGKKLTTRYLAIRKEFHLSDDSHSLAFTDMNGTALKEESLPQYLLESKRTRISQEFNANYCRGLLNARYGLTKPVEQGASK